MKIGPFTLAAPLALAPMAGVTDLPFRRLCRRLGAGIAASEMVTSDGGALEYVKIASSARSRDEPGRASGRSGYDRR